MSMREEFEKEYPVPFGLYFDHRRRIYVVNLESPAAHICVASQREYGAKWDCWQKSRRAIVLPEPPHGDSFVTLQQVKQSIGIE